VSGASCYDYLFNKEEMMTKPRLNEDSYIAELNRRLAQHPDYSPGMAFIPYPEYARGGAITGLSTIGLGFRHAYRDTEAAVQNEFDIELTRGGGLQTSVK
jgi:hypothetical protein